MGQSESGHFLLQLLLNGIHQRDQHMAFIAEMKKEGGLCDADRLGQRTRGELGHAFMANDLHGRLDNVMAADFCRFPFFNGHSIFRVQSNADNYSKWLPDRTTMPHGKKRQQREWLPPNAVTPRPCSGTTGAFLHPCFFEHESQRAEAGHAALRQVGADENSAPEPGRIAAEMGEGEAEQHHQAGYQMNGTIYGHKNLLLLTRFSCC